MAGTSAKLGARYSLLTNPKILSISSFISEKMAFQNMIKTQIECILLSGLNERVTKADAAVICEFHEGWLVDMDEGRGEDYNHDARIILGDDNSEIMVQALRRTIY